MDKKSGPAKKGSCPCKASSNGKDWNVKCFTCGQSWHASCCNLKGLNNITDESKLNKLLTHWECPWCFVTPFPPPASSESSKLKENLRKSVDEGKQKQIIEDIVIDTLSQKAPGSDLKRVDNLVQSLQTEVSKLQELKTEGFLRLLDLQKEVSSLQDLRSQILASPVPLRPQQTAEHVPEI